MDEDRLRALATTFYRAFLTTDRAALTEVVAADATWIVALDTVLSGAHMGPEGIVALRNRIEELTDGTWRPFRADSFDLATSLWHAVLMDRFLAERGAHRLDSHEAIVIAVEDGRIVRLFHYLHDPAAFAAFWAH